MRSGDVRSPARPPAEQQPWQPLPPDDLSLLATRLARAIAEAEKSAPDRAGQAVVCRLGATRIALPITSVREVVLPVPTYPLPRAPAAVLGMSNVRGRVVPVVDAARLLSPGDQRAATAAEPDGRILLLERAEGELGLLVAAVEGIIPLPEGQDGEPQLVLPRRLEMLLEAMFG